MFSVLISDPRNFHSYSFKCHCLCLSLKPHRYLVKAFQENLILCCFSSPLNPRRTDLWCFLRNMISTFLIFLFRLKILLSCLVENVFYLVAIAKVFWVYAYSAFFFLGYSTITIDIPWVFCNLSFCFLLLHKSVDSMLECACLESVFKSWDFLLFVSCLASKLIQRVSTFLHGTWHDSVEEKNERVDRSWGQGENLKEFHLLWMLGKSFKLDNDTINSSWSLIFFSI